MCCKAPCPCRGLPLPGMEGCRVVGAALQSWVSTGPPDGAVQLGQGSGCLPAPTDVALSQKDRTPGRDYIILTFWEITRFLGTRGSPPERGLKPLALALCPNQGRPWAATECANEASPRLQRQPSVVPQPPLPPEVGGCSVAGHRGAAPPAGLVRAGWDPRHGAAMPPPGTCPAGGLQAPFSCPSVRYSAGFVANGPAARRGWRMWNTGGVKLHQFSSR